MANRKTDGITVEVAEQQANEQQATVRVFLPLMEDQESALEVDQTEYVTINGKTTAIKRGEYVDVPVPVFMQLRNKYPHL